MNEKIIRITVLPTQIRAMTTKDNNGDYNIYINSSMAFESQQKAYDHEIEHIKNGDYDHVVDIGIREFYLHN